MSRQPHPLATLAQLVSTPSQQDGIPRDLEVDLRTAGCMLIQEAGIMLDLTMATAQVVFHRFFYVSSMCSFGVQDISIAALYLSTKLNETPTRLRDLINTYMFLAARIRWLLAIPADEALPYNAPGPSSLRGGPVARASDSRGAVEGKGKGKGKAGEWEEERPRGKTWEGFVWEVPSFHDEVFWDWKDTIVASEMQILKRLGFNMQVDLPYNHAINYLKILDLVFEPDVAQTTWSILNDLLLTPAYAIHPPHVLACAAILLTTRLLAIPLPEDWYVLFDVELDDIRSVSEWAVRLWQDWGLEPASSVQLGRKSDIAVPAGEGEDKGKAAIAQREENEDGLGERRVRENRWRRAWVLMQSKRAVRRWVEDMDRQGEAAARA